MVQVFAGNDKGLRHCLLNKHLDSLFGGLLTSKKMFLATHVQVGF